MKNKNIFRGLVFFTVSLILSRIIFMFIDDPEGPNLLVVVATAGVIYFISNFVFNRFKSHNKLSNALGVALLIQIIVSCAIYLLAR